VDATFSPDGKWMAYSSNESGTDDVFVRPFPNAGVKWRISNGGGKYPMWSHNGRELFYVSETDDRIMVSNYVVRGNLFTTSRSHVWADLQVLNPHFIRVLDLHPDGKHFAVFPREQFAETKGNLHAMFLLNFVDELQRRVRGNSK